MTETPPKSLLEIPLLTLDPLHIELRLPLFRSGVGPLPLLRLLLLLMAMVAALGVVLANDRREGPEGLFVSLLRVTPSG